MLGVFDSGTGGNNALGILKRHLKSEDIVLFTDKRNAPYGTKSRRQILGITKENIRILRSIGARRILIACCTASTIYPYLTDEERRFTYGSLAPTADRVKKTGAKRVALLATERTVKEGTFQGLLPECSLFSFAAQPLVKFIDSGACDGNITGECRDYLNTVIPKINNLRPELVILGCTHFHSLKKTIEEALGIPAVSSAYEGAMAFLHDIKDEAKEGARTLRLS